MSRILKSSGAAGTATLISRILGYVREWAYGWFLGVGPVADAFVTAFTIPNLFRRLLGEGALTAAFVPIFAAKDREGDEEGMWRATNAVLSAVVTACAVITLIALAVLSGALHWMEMDVRHELVFRLMRWMFPYVILVCAAAVLIGVLNARGRFFLPALGATMLNIVMIGSVLLLATGAGSRWFGRSIETQVFGLAAGVLIAGLAQAAFQLPALWRDGFRPRWVNPLRDETVREVARRMGPATLGAAAFQVNVTLTQFLSQSQGPSITSAFNFAVRLLELPQGVIGISLATFLLTELSGLAAGKKFPQFRQTLLDGLGHLIFLNMLAGVLLFVLAEPTIRLLFQYGRFKPDATPLVAGALRMLAPALLAYSVNNVLARAFYALGNTRAPMKISVACLGCNLILVAAFLPLMRQAGMGLANTLSAVLNTTLLFYGLKRALPKLDLRSLLPGFMGALGAGVVAGITAWALFRLVDSSFGHQSIPARCAGVFLPGLVAGLVYMGLGLWMGLRPARELLHLCRSRTSAPAEPPGSDDPDDPESPT